MAEVMTGPMPFSQAERCLAGLITSSGSFSGGSKPVVGRLKTSYGYGKVIGIKSFDNKVYTRIDFDPEKGYHFNFINDNTGEKICILINDMTASQYNAYIDMLTKSRGIIDPDKRPILSSISPDASIEPGDDPIVSFYEAMYSQYDFSELIAYYEALSLEEENIKKL